jgi:hypothetical protein
MIQLFFKIFRWNVLKWILLGGIAFIVVLLVSINLYVHTVIKDEWKRYNPGRYTHAKRLLEERISIPKGYFEKQPIHQELYNRFHDKDHSILSNTMYIKQQEALLDQYYSNTFLTKNQWVQIPTLIKTIQPSLEYYQRLAVDLHQYYNQLPEGAKPKRITDTLLENRYISHMFVLAALDAQNSFENEKSLDYYFDSLVYYVQSPTLKLFGGYYYEFEYKTRLFYDVRFLCQQNTDEQTLKKIFDFLNSFESLFTYCITDNEYVNSILVNTSSRFNLTEQEILAFQNKTVREYIRYILDKTQRTTTVSKSMDKVYQMYLADFASRKKRAAWWDLMRSLSLSSLREFSDIYDLIHYRNLSTYIGKKFETKESFDLLRLTIAAQLYKIDKGFYPNKLPELVTTYFSPESQKNLDSENYDISQDGAITVVDRTVSLQ